MCGRFAFYSPSEATAALFGVANAAAIEPRYNIAPTQYIAAVRNAEDDRRELAMLRWGLIPFWAKDPSIGNRMNNARAETVAEKPSFRAAFRHRRCLVLADGFYEWQREGGHKVPYFISRQFGEPFAFAALWEHWADKSSDATIDSATLLTTAASEAMSPLHHRMPIILDPERADRWMDGDNTVIDDAATSAPKLRAWPVDRRVNNARHEGDELILPDGDTLDV